MVDKDDALLREVDEELRREQWARLWERYGTTIFAVAAALILLVVGYRMYQERQLSRSAEAGSAYNEAMRLAEAGKADESAQKLATLSTAPGGYPALAELQKAGALLKAGRPLDSLPVFEAVAWDSAAPRLARDFATLQAASIRVGTADFTEIQNRLTPLATEKSPWRHMARELVGLAAIKAGKFDEARVTLGAVLGDREAPRTAVERARVLLSSLAASELSKAAATAPPGAATAVPAPAAPATSPGPSPAK